VLDDQQQKQEVKNNMVVNTTRIIKQMIFSSGLNSVAQVVKTVMKLWLQQVKHFAPVYHLELE